MLKVKRWAKNPILSPSKNSWENDAVFNGCPIKRKRKIHLFYRAMSLTGPISSIGHSQSKDGIHFKRRREFIKPEYDWEAFGCEDPRITKLDDVYYIFYTALSAYPFTAESIKIGLAITKNFKKIKKYPVTTFNSKAMALFPERIKGKIVALLTVHTDMPPAKIALALFNKPEEIWSRGYWQNWYNSLEQYTIPLLRNTNDQVELGAPPIKTKKGWLLIYCYIKDYLGFSRIFGIEAVLLDLQNPLRVLGRTREPLLIPQEEYELQGNVPKVVFPSGAMIDNNRIFIYYGAADTTCCLAICDLDDLIKELV